MSDKTPGQAAQEASAAILLERFGDVVKPWDEASADTRDGWETIAQAAIAAQESGTADMTPAAPMPNPGSLAALAQGCLCPQLENHYGHRAPYEPDTWVIAMGCPVHARRAPGPAPELAAAMEETRRMRALIDEITQDITRKSGVSSPYLLRKAASVRQRAGLA